MDNTPRAVLLILVLIFLLITPDNQRSTPAQQVELHQLLEEERHAINLLNATQFGDLNAEDDKWVNVTGLRKEDGYAWDLLPKVKARSGKQLEHILEPWRDLKKSHPNDIGLGERYESIVTIDEGPTIPSNASSASAAQRQIVPFYQNITGTIRGQWARSEIGTSRQRPVLNTTALAPDTLYITKEYNRNISGSHGDIQIKLDEKKSEVLRVGHNSVRQIRAEIIIKDETSSGDGWEFSLHGVHYPESGGVLLSTSGEKFAGIFALPHFARSEVTFSLAQQLLNKTLTTSIRQQQLTMFSAPSYPWSSSPNNPGEMLFPTPHCEYIVYLQQHVPDFTGSTADEIYRHLSEMQELEHELRSPSGASLRMVPKIMMSAIIFSPDCGFVLESVGPPESPQQVGNHLRGPKLEQYLHQVKDSIFVFALIICTQIFLLVRQMKDASTPSMRSRISFYTIAIGAMGDGIVTMSFMVVSMFIDAAFLVLISTAFLALISASFLGMRFLMEIWKTQAPERQERERRDAAADSAMATTPLVAITPAGADTLPLPATARRATDTGATSIMLPPDQDIEAAEAEDTNVTTQPALDTLGSARREMGALYSRFYFLLFGILLLSLYATSWPTVIRSIYTNTLAFIYCTLWIPQIHRNIIRNCRKALRWEFVIGQSILRFAPIFYFYTISDNIVFAESDRYAAYALAGFVWIQVWVLLSQELLGPRFFVPKGWAPPAYDYHPVLREDDEEAGAAMPIGFTQATSSNASPTSLSISPDHRGQKTFDCAICMQNINVSVVPSDSGGEVAASLGTSLFSNGRRAYMVTPCRHIFHSPCLEGWMRYRLQCPICRETLPPL